MNDTKAKQPRGIAKALNSPLALLIISTVIFGGAAKIYSDHQETVKDQISRRGPYVKLLAEYQQRVSALTSADGRLNAFLGEGPGIKPGHKLDPKSAESRRWEAEAAKAGKLEWAIIHGTEGYLPTSPDYRNVSLQLVATQMDDIGGMPDIQFGAIRMLGFLDADSSIIWWPVRSYLPMLQTWGVGRYMLSVNGELPLKRGDKLTPREEAVLGIPQLHPGDLERIMGENDALHNQIQAMAGN